MTRSNGSGFPPNGWPAGYPQPDPSQPYQNQYPAQPQYPQPAPPQQPVTTGRPARIQHAIPPAQGRPPQAPPPAYGQPQPGYAAPQPYGQSPPSDPYAPAPSAYPAQPAAYGIPQAPQQTPQYPSQRPVAPAYAVPVSPLPANPVTQPPPAYPPASAYNPAAYDFSAVPTTRPTAPPARQSPPPAYASPYQQPAVPQQTYVPPQQPSAPYNTWQGGSPPSIDPQGYDLGAYTSVPQNTVDPRTGRPTGPAWQQAPVPAAAYGAPAPAGYGSPDPGYGSLGTPLEAGFEPDLMSEGQEHDEQYDEPQDDDYAEGGSRPRYGLILASVVAAFAVGGGLTYAYKAVFAPNTHVAGAPVVKSGSDPFKVKPADPGGTKFSNTDSKVMDQLGGSDGPRVVQTMKVERDGSITTGSTTAPPSPASAPASSASVPGMILDGGPQRGRAVPPASAGSAVMQAGGTSPPPPAAAPPVDVLPAAVPQAPVKKTSKQAALPAAVAPAAVAAAPKAPTGANGYVAVLASMPASGSSRMQAMQQFADLQQKYADVLSSKAPDVVEAKLDKGTYHRLVVGPPASRDSAKQVCDKLKAAGYTSDCWVTAF